MQCPECGYMMSAFEKECPRCKNLKAAGVAPQLPAKKVQEPAVVKPAPVSVKPAEARPLRVVSPNVQDSRFDNPPAVTEPAPLIIYTNRVIRWQPWAALVAVILVVAGVFLWWQESQAAITKAIVLAARQGACERMPENETQRDIDACTQLTGALTYHIVRDAPQHATVTFFMSGMVSSLSVVVNQDDEGDWHAVSANEGDEGSRTPWSDRRFNDPPPATPPADNAPPPAMQSPGESSAPVEPAGPAGPSAPASISGSPPPDNGPSSDPAYTMPTQAGGGPPPDTTQFQPPPSSN